MSFYKSSAGTTLHTSVAQLFNEKGEGVVVKGGPAAVLKEDRCNRISPRMTPTHPRSQRLDAYRKEHGNYPARLVIHKSSRYMEGERSGFGSAAEEARIDLVELLWLSENDPSRLFSERVRIHRCAARSYLSPMTDTSSTRRGASTSTAPIPACTSRPHFRFARSMCRTPRADRAEILAHQAELEPQPTRRHLPITLHAAAKVKAMLRHVPDSDVPGKPHAHYM